MEGGKRSARVLSSWNDGEPLPARVVLEAAWAAIRCGHFPILYMRSPTVFRGLHLGFSFLAENADESAHGVFLPPRGGHNFG